MNERRYEFGDTDGADDWVCAKIPNDGRIKKDCVPKREAPGWYVHLLENRDFKVRREKVIQKSQPRFEGLQWRRLFL